MLSDLNVSLGTGAKLFIYFGLIKICTKYIKYIHVSIHPEQFIMTSLQNH